MRHIVQLPAASVFLQCIEHNKNLHQFQFATNNL